MEQVNCLCSLEEILHFCGYLKILWIRELKVTVKKMAHYMDFQVIIIEFSYVSPAFGPSLTQNTSGQHIVHGRAEINTIKPWENNVNIITEYLYLCCSK